MDEKSLVIGLLAKTLNKPVEELSELLYQKSEDDGSEKLKDDSLDVSLDLIEKKISKVKSSNVDTKKIFDGAYKQAHKEIMEEFEKELRGKYELETEKTGLDLIDEVVNKFKSDDSKLTPDKIKISDTYRNREKELKKEMKDLKDQFETEKAEILTGFQKKETWGVVSKGISKKLDEINPVLPKNPKAASNLKELFIGSFSEFEWQLDADGKPLPTKAGKRVEDNLGNEIDFDAMVTGRIPEYFDIPAQGDKGGAGNDNKGGGAKTAGVPASFKDDNDYLKFVNNEPDPLKRIAAKNVWKAQQAKG
jgi:hypothetical protein